MVKPLVLLALGALSCGVDDAERTPQPPILAVTLVPSDAEAGAYARGATAQIRFVQRALQAGGPVRWTIVDSVGAAAAGMTIERFRAVSVAVETALKERVVVDRQERLDSLRVELMLLRVRTQGLQ